jgi:hypothetical protein
VQEILEAARQMGDIDRFKQGIEVAKGLLQHLARSAQQLDTLIWRKGGFGEYGERV